MSNRSQSWTQIFLSLLQMMFRSIVLDVQKVVASCDRLMDAPESRGCDGEGLPSCPSFHLIYKALSSPIRNGKSFKTQPSSRPRFSTCCNQSYITVYRTRSQLAPLPIALPQASPVYIYILFYTPSQFPRLGDSFEFPYQNVQRDQVLL